MLFFLVALWRLGVEDLLFNLHGCPTPHMKWRQLSSLVLLGVEGNLNLSFEYLGLMVLMSRRFSLQVTCLPDCFSTWVCLRLDKWEKFICIGWKIFVRSVLRPLLFDSYCLELVNILLDIVNNAAVLGSETCSELHIYA